MLPIPGGENTMVTDWVWLCRRGYEFACIPIHAMRLTTAAYLACCGVVALAARLARR